jgi:CBS domain-containing protein
VSVRDAVERAVVVAEEVPVATALRRVSASSATGAVVVNGAGHPVGAAALERLAEVAAGDGAAPISTIAVRVVVSADETLEDAMLAQAGAAAHVAAVVEHGTPLGIATTVGLLGAYRHARESRRGRSDPARPPS